MQTGAHSVYVKDTTTKDFRQDVMTESMAQPVLVDFWAPWCGPCKQLGPALEKAVAGANGRVKMVKLNIDEHPEIAGQLRIQSIPAVIAFSKGQPVDGFVGAIPESQIKSFVERLAGPAPESAANELLAEAERHLADGGATEAAEIYAAILQSEPFHLKAAAGLCKAYLALGQIEQAKAALAALPAEKALDPIITGAKAAVEIAEQAASLGDIEVMRALVAREPRNNQAQFDLALALNARGAREDAIDQLIAIIRRDRQWNEDAARKQLVQFFEAWGFQDETTQLGRRKLSSVLFS